MFLIIFSVTGVVVLKNYKSITNYDTLVFHHENEGYEVYRTGEVQLHSS